MRALFGHLSIDDLADVPTEIIAAAADVWEPLCAAIQGDDDTPKPRGAITESGRDE